MIRLWTRPPPSLLSWSPSGPEVPPRVRGPPRQQGKIARNALTVHEDDNAHQNMHIQLRNMSSTDTENYWRLIRLHLLHHYYFTDVPSGSSTFTTVLEGTSN